MCPVVLVLLEIDGAMIGCLSETVRFSSSELRKIGHYNIVCFYAGHMLL